MIKKLEKELQIQIATRNKVLEPFNKRIKNLKIAINNLKQFNQTADEMNEKAPLEAGKIEEII